MSKTLKHTLHRDKLKLIEVMNKMVLTSFYKIFHPKTHEYTFLLATHGTFSKIDHIKIKQV